jgi:hypothetical protein
MTQLDIIRLEAYSIIIMTKNVSQRLELLRLLKNAQSLDLAFGLVQNAFEDLKNDSEFREKYPIELRDQILLRINNVRNELLEIISRRDVP